MLLIIFLRGTIYYTFNRKTVLGVGILLLLDHRGCDYFLMFF